MVDSTIAEKGAVESGLARELAVTLVHAPDFESKVSIILVYLSLVLFLSNLT